MKFSLFSLGIICLFVIGCAPKERFLDEVHVVTTVQKKQFLYDESPFTGTLIDRSNPAGKVIYIVEQGYINGAVKHYDAAGQLLLRENYLAGELNGLVESFFPNGTKRYAFNYLKGRKSGKQLRYYPSGSLKEELFYQGDQLKGDNFLYYPNGILQHHFHFNAQGQRHGLWEKFHSNGQLKEEASYDSGQLIPPIKRFDRSGKRVNYTP